MDQPTGNPCGDCNVCCVHLPIAESDMPFMPGGKKAHQMCPKWDGGCSIHNARPQVCRSYFCLWLQHSLGKENFPEAWRPDRSGICISTYRSANQQQVVVNFVEAWRGAMNPARWSEDTRHMMHWVARDLAHRFPGGQVRCARTDYSGHTSEPVGLQLFFRALLQGGIIGRTR